MTEGSLKGMFQAEEPSRRFAAEVRSPDEPQEYQGFSFGRVGTRPQLMLCVVKCDGHHLVLPYADLRAITSNDPDKGFLLEFAGREILIEGTSLMICFRYLRDQRLSELVEANRPEAMSSPNDAPVVQKITIRKPRPHSEKSSSN
jgi:hypothetical protein